MNPTVPIPASWRALGLHVGKSRDPDTERHLARVLDTFFVGYGQTLQRRDPMGTVAAIAEADRGWAWEGVAMAMTLGGLMMEDDLEATFALLHTHAARHVPLVYAGVGYAFGRLRRPLAGPPEGAHPFWGWMAIDGYAFYLALRRPRRYIERAHPPPDETQGDARHLLYQGLGRSTWFTRAGDPNAIASGIGGLPAEYHADLWRGVGIGMAYTGFVDDTLVTDARELAGPFASDLGVGVAVATYTRAEQQAMPTWTDRAANLICNRPPLDLAELGRGTLAPTLEAQQYLEWCAALRQALQG